MMLSLACHVFLQRFFTYAVLFLTAFFPFFSTFSFGRKKTQADRQIRVIREANYEDAID